MRRRGFLGIGLGALAGAWATTAHAGAGGIDEANLEAAMRGIERDSGGRLGVALVEVGAGRRFAYRGGERFPMCSTFKALLAAAVLQRVDRGEERLDRRVAVTAADIVPGSLFTATRAGGDAAVLDLCEATMTLSDNAAANLLLPSIGGPEGFTRFARSIGDPVTRLDRIEPALNEAAVGDLRDTTTPEAMARSFETLVFGDVLTPSSRGTLTRWLIDNRTGGDRLRAGLPAGWGVGDKTGVGENGTTNDVAVLWPPDGPALILACYLTQSRLDAAGRNAIHANVARAVATAVG